MEESAPLVHQDRRESASDAKLVTVFGTIPGATMWFATGASSEEAIPDSESYTKYSGARAIR